MKDRVSTYPGRVKLVPVAGQANIYDLERADQPVEAGTPLNKATLLADRTAAILGLGESATVDDAIFKSYLLAAGGNAVAVTVRDYMGNAISDVTVSGIKTAAGGACITDATGYTLGFSSAASVSLSVSSPYIDLQGASKSLTVADGYAEVALTMQKAASNYKAFTSSANVKFSKCVASVDVCCVGGGGGGAGGNFSSSRGGGGGGGGYVTNKLNVVVVANQPYQIVVGAGGASGVAKTGNGGNGGSSSVFGILGSGGTGGIGDAGGAGNGIGGNGGRGGHIVAENGSAGTVYEFGDTSRVKFGGGGAGGNLNSTYLPLPTGGAPYGGGGGSGRSNGGNGVGAGGGGQGGGTSTEYKDYYNGGSGYAGQVSLRWRYKT